MTDQEKFRYFKEQKIRENEANSVRITEAYGEIIEQSNQKWQQMTQVDVSTDRQRKPLIAAVKELLTERKGNESLLTKAQMAAAHQAWLNKRRPFTQQNITIFREMYVQDERFTAYYDQKSRRRTRC